MKTVEYKETAVFELFPDLEYTRRQRKRLILFHAYAKNIRKIIHYASHFDAPNKICLVYVIGQPKEAVIRSELEKWGCSDRVCVLTSAFPEDGFTTYEQYRKLKDRLISTGYWNKENDCPSPVYYEERRKYRVARKNPEVAELCKRRLEEYEINEEIIHQYKRLCKASRNTHFKRWRCYRRGHLTKPYTHERLDELIIKIFPLSVEACSLSDYASLSPAAIPLGIKLAEAQIFDAKLNIKPEQILSPAKAIAGFIGGAIREKGYCALSELADFCMSPPFGLDYNAFSAACFISALKRFAGRTLLFYDSCNAFRVSNCAEVVFSLTFAADRRGARRRIDGGACLFLETAPHKRVKQFMSELWKIKPEMPGTLMALHLSQKLCKDHRLPLSSVDPRLLQMTLWNIRWYDIAEVSRLAEDIVLCKKELLKAYELYKERNRTIPPHVKAVFNADYSWAWSAETCERLLNKFGGGTT